MHNERYLVAPMLTTLEFPMFSNPMNMDFTGTTLPTLLTSWNDSSYANESSLLLSEYYDPPPELWLRHSVSVSIVFCLAYAVVFFLGIFGNSFVVAVVIRSPRMRTVTNYFIVNLALADILVLVFCLPATLLGNLLVPWMLGLLMCKTVSYLQGVSVSASINTLVAISIDRYLAICYPLKCQMSRRSARKVILIIWGFSLLISLPWAIFFQQRAIDPDLEEVQLCVEVWPHEQAEKMYFLVANLVLCYLLPIFIITPCYIAIWWKVWRRNIPGETKNNKQMDYVMQRSKLKVVKMMLVVVIIFVLSWLPLYIIFARIKIGGTIEADSWQEKLLMVTAPIAQWLGASNSCINPILYAYFNRKFRRGFLAIIRSRKCCSTLRYEYAPRQTTTMRSVCKLSKLSRFDTQCDYLSVSAV